MKWNEKDAIRGHSVDRYHYAVQLVHGNTDEGLVKAFAWLSLAADEVDMREDANLLKHKVGFELKKRCIFQNALILEQSYRDRYSSEALRKKIAKSKNPIYMFLRVTLSLLEATIKLIDTIDVVFFKEKGSASVWGIVAGCQFILGIFVLLNCYSFSLTRFNLFLSISFIFSSVIIMGIWDKRGVSEKER